MGATDSSPSMQNRECPLQPCSVGSILFCKSLGKQKIKPIRSGTQHGDGERKAFDLLQVGEARKS